MVIIVHVIVIVVIIIAVSTGFPHFQCFHVYHFRPLLCCGWGHHQSDDCPQWSWLSLRGNFSIKSRQCSGLAVIYATVIWKLWRAILISRVEHSITLRIIMICLKKVSHPFQNLKFKTFLTHFRMASSRLHHLTPLHAAQTGKHLCNQFGFHSILVS